MAEAELSPENEIVQGETGKGLMSQPSPAYPVPPQLIESAPVSLREFVRSLADDDAMEDQRALSVAYDRAVSALIGANDVQEEGGRTFKKKSAWRKLGRFFHLSTQLVSQSGGWIKEPNPLTEKDSVDFVALVTMRAVAPWGQYMEATASCSTRELRFLARTPVCPVCKGLMWDNRNPPKGEEWKSAKGDFACRDKGCSGALAQGEYDPDTIGQLIPNPTAFSKARHDCMSTAQTRASNRAISDLIAAGEVSWEEVQGGDQKSYGGQAKSQPPKEAESSGSPPPESEETGDLLAQKVGFGKHEELTWLEIIEQHSGYIQSVFDKPWGRKRVPPGSPLHDALRLAVETRQDVQEDADPEAPPHQTAGVMFVKACTDYSITAKEWETFAKVHRDFPDDIDSWTEEDYERIMGIFQRKGVRASIDRAVRATQPPGEGIPEDKVSQARRLVIRCRESEVGYWEDHSRNVEAAINASNAAMLDDAVTRLQQALLDHLAKGGKPPAGQRNMEF